MGYDIDSFVGEELGLAAFGDGGVCLAPVEDCAEPVEHVVLLAGAALFGEGVAGVTGEAAWEVLSDVAVGDGFGAVHHDFCAVVDLRYAVDGEQQCQSLLEHQGVLAVAEEAVGVVVVKEGEDALWVGVEVVIDESVVDAVHASSPLAGLLVLGRVQAVKEGEVHDGVEVGVGLSLRRTAGHGGC